MNIIKNNIEKIHNSIIEKRNSSILIVAGGISFQVLTWLLFAAISINICDMWIAFPIIVFILVIPVISIYGIIVSIIQIRKKYWIVLPIIGMLLNIVWITVYIMFLLFIFKYGAAI